MSHDIRTPMNGILGLINDVLQLSKLEDPEVTLSYEAFDAKQMAEDVLTIVKMRATEYGITVEYDASEQRFTCPYVWGSPLHVRQIFINVFSNSIKYNKKGGKISSKTLCRKTAEDQVIYHVEIEDTGIGMSEEFLNHLFEPFAIAQKEDVVNPDAEETQGNISGVRVLLVEDNDLNMEIAETFLKDAGAEVTKAFNGQQAVYLFDKSEPDQFDVILMDVMMPVMNGYEATRNIRALNRPDAKTIPIIAMTANAFVEDIQESKDAGMNEHISKPLDITKVISLIGKYWHK